MIRRAVLVYAACNLVFFLFGVYALRIREIGLYLYVLAVGVPASLFVVPASEYIAPALGWSAGSMPHVWFANLLACLCNCALILFGVRAAAAVRRRRAD
jgi:hypothetical protein